MTDIVNAYFRRFYPVGLSRNNGEHWAWNYLGWQYEGPGRYRGRMRASIFPEMLCADGFSMSVQGHCGAYSSPRNDFAEDGYTLVEILLSEGRQESLLDEAERGAPIGNDIMNYSYVEIGVVLAVIEKHGGLFDWNATDLGVPGVARNTTAGDPCPTIGCSGHIEIVPAGDCSCHLHPPCPACTEAGLVCGVCGFELERQ